ncbi:hypothetical protein VNO78_07536 [Psophocarpus tetragonolobus]|uniref:Uncharacterized protein n=1 Tax=Psophocarpus tetragonolobus TaxID=3891 RepID=A0AAN9XSH5_PSOTE
MTSAHPCITPHLPRQPQTPSSLPQQTYKPNPLPTFLRNSQRHLLLHFRRCQSTRAATSSMLLLDSITGGRCINHLYRQLLHYLTNILLKQWDQLRIGSVNEYKLLDTIIHPRKVEATIWLIEEIHSETSSHFHIATLWNADPIYNAFVDSIFPKLDHNTSKGLLA